jgi:hypothetical protein
VECTLWRSSVPRACRQPFTAQFRGPVMLARPFAPEPGPACGGLSGALAISRASGDVDAMLKSLCVGRVRTYGPSAALFALFAAIFRRLPTAARTLPCGIVAASLGFVFDPSTARRSCLWPKGGHAAAAGGPRGPGR